MKLLAALTILVGSIGSAGATVITYNTTGSAFTMLGASSISSPSITVTNGTSTATLTYSPLTGNTFDDATPGTNISYGFFTLTYSGGATPASILFPTFTFSLAVNETAPNASARTVIGTSAGGTVTAASSSLNVAYTPTGFTLPATGTPNTVFSVFSPTPIVAPSTNSGVSTIQGFAVGTPSTATPEPTSMLLMGAGLIGLGSISRKRFSTRS